LLDLVEAVEGSGRRHACAVREAACDSDPACALHPVWAEAQTAFIDVLAGASIGELAARQRAADELVGPLGPERIHR
jgi:DNA-binding IscR family transcriptional regulator